MWKLFLYNSYFCLIANLKNHIGVNHKETNIFACKICEFSTNNKENLKTHEKTHAGRFGKFTCSNEIIVLKMDLLDKFHAFRA